jgi:transposase
MLWGAVVAGPVTLSDLMASGHDRNPRSASASAYDRVQRLPDDPQQLKRLLAEAVGALQERDERIAELSHIVRELQRWRFGRRSELVPAEQLLFSFVRAFDAPERPAGPPPATAPQPAGAPRKPKPHGRRLLPADLNLPRERTVVDLPPEQKQCAGCRRDLVQIGQEVSSKLDYKPGQLLIRETLRPKWACRHCEGHGVSTGELPAHRQPAIPRCLAAPGLLAWTIVQKYQFHIPLYRQSAIYRSQGIDLSDSTLGGWVGRCANLLGPVHEAMKQDILRSEVMNTDDSPMRVLDPEPLKHRSREARLHTHVGDRNHCHVLFLYAPDRRHRWALDFLMGYRGFLQADLWQGYDALFKTGRMTEVACWAHARRYFFEAKETDSQRALIPLTYNHQLHEIEDEARGLSADQRLRMRMREAYAVPVLGVFKKWIDEELATRNVMPRTPTRDQTPCRSRSSRPRIRGALRSQEAVKIRRTARL